MTASVARLPLRPARPAIEIDGQRVAALEAALLSYSLADSIDSIAHAELVFGNWGGGARAGFQHFDRRTLDFGKPIVVKMGSDALFEGRITAIAAEFPEGSPPQISILAEDRLQPLRMTRRTRSFAQSSLADVARRIAGDHQLQAQVDVDAPAAPLLAQLNQSDLAFLRDLARAVDAEVFVTGTTLHVARTRGAATLALAWAGTLRSFEVAADLAHQRTAVVASGWDVAAKAGVSHKAGIAAIRAELGNDDAGADILARALGERVDTRAHGMPTSAAEARAFAESSFRHMARSFVTGEGVCETDPKLRVGTRLELTGLGPLFDGAYRANAVDHLYDADLGARSEFRCDRPGLGRV